MAYNSLSKEKKKNEDQSTTTSQLTQVKRGETIQCLQNNRISINANEQEKLVNATYAPNPTEVYQRNDNYLELIRIHFHIGPSLPALLETWKPSFLHQQDNIGWCE
jgi:hypothetical protein